MKGMTIFVDTGSSCGLIDRHLSRKLFRSIMPMSLLGKLLFPRLPVWERRRRVRMIIAVWAVAVLFAAIVGALIYFQNTHR
jgi:hypothetical protein